MKRDVIEFQSEAEWLALRDTDLTSTEVSALFGVSPYATEYELWHRKTGQLVAEFEGNERTVWGNRLESAIAYGVAEDLGLIVEPFKVYVRLPEHRLGASFDFKVVGLVDGAEENEYRDLFRQYGPGLMEVKNVDGLVFRRGWLEEDGDIEAPAHIELQVQHQQLATGMKWSVVAPLIAGNTPRPFYRLADEKVHNAILKKVDAFWKSIDDGKAPAPNYAEDADTIVALLLNDDGEQLDMTEDDHFDEVCAAYKSSAADEKAAASRKEAAKGEILNMMGTAAGAKAAHYKVSAKTRKGTPDKTITPDMVGQVINGRKATRFPRVTELKG